MLAADPDYLLSTATHSHARMFHRVLSAYDSVSQREGVGVGVGVGVGEHESTHSPSARRLASPGAIPPGSS
jgi:hypothetical protein